MQCLLLTNESAKTSKIGLIVGAHSLMEFRDLTLQLGDLATRCRVLFLRRAQLGTAQRR